MPQRRRSKAIRRSFQRLQSGIRELGECGETNVRRHPFKRVVCYVRRLSEAYTMHQCSLMACACAYCAMLSLVPLLIIGISLIGYIVGGSQHALDDTVRSIRDYVPINPAFLRDTLNHVLQNRHILGLFGIIGLIYGAHQTFLAMEPAMNIIWVVPENRHWVRQRLVALGATFLSIVLIGADMAASAAVAIVFRSNLHLFSGRVDALLFRIGLSIIPVLLITLLFMLLYQILPARDVPLKPGLIGAGVAALLWQATKLLFGLFLVYSQSYNRLYGSLSSLVILVVWAYYTMAILLLGAEIAADYEYMRHGRRAAAERSHAEANLSVAKGTEHRETKSQI